MTCRNGGGHGTTLTDLDINPVKADVVSPFLLVLLPSCCFLSLAQRHILAMRREIRHVFIRIVPSKKGDIILVCPEEDLRHFARRPSAWIRAVCTWIVGCDGRLEVSTDFQASGDNKTCHSVDLTSDAVWPYYIFTAKPTAGAKHVNSFILADD